MDSTYAYVLRGSKEDIDYIEDIIREETELDIVYMTAHNGIIKVVKE